MALDPQRTRKPLAYRSMNELSLILEFIAEGEEHVRGRSVGLDTAQETLLAGVCDGKATDVEREQAAVLMRDNEDALLFFAGLLAKAESAGEESKAEEK